MSELKLNVVLIDDHHMLSQSLENLLRKYEFINTVKTYPSPKSFLEELAKPYPDIIVSDIMMPDMNGMDLLQHLRSIGVYIKVLILSSIAEVQTIRHAMRNGASGFLSKESSAEELADALITVYSGEPYIGDSLRKSLLRNTLSEDRFMFSLSPREKEVLNCVCNGKSIKEIAAEMALSANTVQTYHKTILKKFNLSRTADLIVFAVRNGFYYPQNK